MQKLKSPKAGEEWCGAGGKWCGSGGKWCGAGGKWCGTGGKWCGETKLKNKWTLFFELFDLSDHYIFEHLSLHIHFCGWGGSSQKQNSKINGLCFLNFLI